VPEVVHTNEMVIKIPEPQMVRDRLAEVLREADSLRQLLKLSSKLAANKPGAQGQGGHRVAS
jgi:hypothetical protein